ncbi:MAG: tRNA lysidine(34) synthetase TilS [Duncaniella sp.]|nr:tRNA lysidine(34) synthetase TilS [Duncaniella sp.]
MLEKRVTEFLSRHLPQSPRILVGLSGGADSVALLLSLHAAGAECVAAHCNFHLRGDESNRDRRHCEELCDALSVPLLIMDFDVDERRAHTSESVEMACRSLRYEWWNDLITGGKADFIAVGHHKEDNVETFFLNLMRGGGIAGLKAMLPVNGTIIRPLLDVSRQEIEDYVRSRGYSWVTDRTNLENVYTRNRLRNIVLPMLEAEFPGAVNSIVRSLAVLRDNYDLYTNAVRQYTDLYITRDEAEHKVYINISGLIAEQPASHAILHELLSPFGFTHSQIDDIYNCASGMNANASSGQTFVTPNASYIFERGVLTGFFQTEEEANEETIDINAGPFTVTRLTPQEFEAIRRACAFDSRSIYLDSAALAGNPQWTIRTWRQGDRLAPFGMKGTRLVSDIYSDAKLTKAQKRSTRLLLRDGVLIWVIGLRASRHFAVTSSTTEIIRITIADQTR